MPRVIHFEIHAQDPGRAIAFYSAVFGWKFDKWQGPVEYYPITTGPDTARGINGGLLKRFGPPPAEAQPLNSFCCTVDVENLDESLKKAVASGAKVTLPTMPVPGVGWLAYILDTEGNTLGLMQMDSAAK